jgi:hypothetical protein
MQFSTPIPIAKSNHPIDYNSKIVSLGSCFAVNIGQKFDYFKFSNTTNPFGILFHPLALEKFIGYALQEKQFTDADVFQQNDLWHCFDAHSYFSHPNKEALLNNLNSACLLANAQLKEATHLIITLGLHGCTVIPKPEILLPIAIRYLKRNLPKNYSARKP